MTNLKLSENARKQLSKCLMKAMVEPGATTHEILGNLNFWLDENNDLDCDSVSITFPVVPQTEPAEG